MKWLECKIPPVVVFLCMAVLMGWIRSFTGEIGLPLRLRVALAVPLLLAAGILGVTSLTHFRNARTTIHPNHPCNARRLVRTGIYRFTRNPMYLSLLLGLLAESCLLDNAFTLLGCGLFVAYMTRFQILPEEQAMDILFGNTFTEYKARVRRWL